MTINPKRNPIGIRLALIALSLAAIISCQSCSTGKKDATDSAKKDSAATAAAPGYILMEKMLSDQPGRPRTTVKLLIPAASSAAAVTAALQAALSDIRKQDPALKAVMFWAYKSRSELNGPNFTLGRLEWSADGKDFNGSLPLAQNPKIEVTSR